MRNVRFGRTKLFLLSAMLCSGVVRAEAERAEDELDPPDRVARLSFVDGAVSLAPADSDNWADALLNRPVTTGDRIWVAGSGRAEVQIGTSTIHLDENTGLAFLTLDDDTLLLRLTDGGIAVHVHTLQSNESVQVETPNATVMLRQPGEYAINTEGDGDRTVVKSRSGEAEVIGADQHGYIVSANEQGIFTGTDELSSVMTQSGRRSTFETWAYEREALADQSVAANYVASGVVGYRDLDSYGTWSTEPEYGNVWRPSLSYASTDWAPYRYGRWLWVSPWGWTWVDDAPWGYAPFHYGRWTYLRQRWCWVPGPRHVRAAYAPALVAWVGPPSFGVNFREVGWFPLGPREIYLPGYRNSWRHFNHVNAWDSRDSVALSNAYNGRHQNFDYRNRRAPHAVTVIDHDSFVSARRTHGQRVNVDADDLQRWHNQGRVPAIDPNSTSRLGARPTGRAPAPHLNRQEIATRYQPVTRQRALPSQPDDGSAQAALPQGNSLRAPSTRSFATRQWAGSNVGDPPGRLSRTPRPQPDATKPVDTTNSDQHRDPAPRAVTMLPGSTANRPAFHRGTSSQADRPRNAYPRNSRAPAPVASPRAVPPQVSNRPDPPPQVANRVDQPPLVSGRPAQPAQNRHQARQERTTQKQERQARFNAPQQPASAPAPAGRAPSIPVTQAPAQVAPRQVVQQQPQPRAVPRQGDANGRAMVPQQQPRAIRAPQQSRQSSGAGRTGRGSTQ